MDDSLRQALLESGAELDDAGRSALHFGDPAAELRAALRGCALIDRSRLDRIAATGTDLLDLLHRMSTADLKDLQAGSGRSGVLTTPKGRIVERLFVHHLGQAGQLLAAGQGGAKRTIEHLTRYIFTEDVKLSDRSAATCQLALVGPRAGEALAKSGMDRPAPCGVCVTTFEGTPLSVLGQDGLSSDGFSLVVDTEHAARLWGLLSDAVRAREGRPAGELAGEAWRILRGLPTATSELNENHNPLEANLWDAVSFEKGCYVGQEVIARLNTYDKVSRSLVGLELPPGCTLPEQGAELISGEHAVGQVTSAVDPPGWPHPVALAYLKRKASGDALTVRGEEHQLEARVVELPFPDRPAK
jgi:folate-binding protein YgfZ